MSYSIHIRGAAAASLKVQAAAEFDAVKAAQPVHAVDVAAGLAAVTGYLDVVGDAPQGYAWQVTIAGTVQRTPNPTPSPEDPDDDYQPDIVSAVGVSVSIMLVIDQ